MTAAFSIASTWIGQNSPHQVAQPRRAKMRKFLISLAVATSALAVAAPASAQYSPGPQGYGYGQQGYGYNNNYGQVRRLQARIDQIQRQIKRLDRRDVIRNRQADGLRAEARNIERRLRDVSRFGLSPRESRDIEIRVGRLEQQVRYAASYGRNRYGSNGYGQNAYDRDRDGRDDRTEDDHGTSHDNR
jgi:TolA-binding protein